MIEFVGVKSSFLVDAVVVDRRRSLWILLVIDGVGSMIVVMRYGWC